MFLAIRNGIIVEQGKTFKSLTSLNRAQHEIVEWKEPLPPYDPEEGIGRPDPRSDAQKIVSASRRYLNERLREYPSIEEQFDMMYWDAVNGTTTWMDEITRIKNKFPKLTED